MFETINTRANMKKLRVFIFIQSFFIASASINYKEYLENLNAGLELINSDDSVIKSNGSEKGEPSEFYK